MDEVTRKGKPKAREVFGITEDQEEDDRMGIACRIIAFRNVMGMNQTEFYKNAGLPSNTGSHYERGYALPSLTYARILCRRVSMSLDYLYEGKLSSLNGDMAAKVAKRLPVVMADWKDKLDLERRSNERAGLGYVSNQRLQNAKESERTKELYKDLKEAKAAKEKKARNVKA